MNRILLLALATLLLTGCTTMFGSTNAEGERQRDVLNEKLRERNLPTMGWADVDRTIALTNISIRLDIASAEERQAQALERIAEACERANQ